MKRIFFIFFIVLFRLLIDNIYAQQITPFFDYYLMVDYSTHSSRIFSWVLLILTMPFILWAFNSCECKTSQCVALLFYFIRVVPFTSLAMYNPQEYEFYILNLIFLGGLMLFLKTTSFSHLNVMGIKKSSGDPRIITFITLVSVATVIIVSGVYAHFRLHLSLDDVYELREEARGYSMPTLLTYLSSATTNIIPILIIYYISKGKSFWIYLLVFIGLMNFSIAGSKSTLFKIIICIVLYFYKGNFNLPKLFAFSFTIICIASISEFILFKSNTVSTLLVRRVFYVPNLLDTLYYDYINSHSPVFFHSQGLAFSIGDLYFGKEGLRANNGLFTDAYSNLGWIGVFIFPILIGSFIKIFENILKEQDNSIILFSSFLIVITLNGAMFTTSLLTHGLFLLLLTVYYMPQLNSNKNIDVR